MSSYVENNLGKNEVIVKMADKNALSLVITWFFGILFFWLLLIPFIKAIIRTVQFVKIELAVTNKRVIGKVGVLNTSAMDASLNKIQNISCEQTLFGKIFNYSTIVIMTAAGRFEFRSIKNGDQFKGIVMAQIDQFEEERIAQQASQMAKAMGNVLNKE